MLKTKEELLTQIDKLNGHWRLGKFALRTGKQQGYHIYQYSDAEGTLRHFRITKALYTELQSFCFVPTVVHVLNINNIKEIIKQKASAGNS